MSLLFTVCLFSYLEYNREQDRASFRPSLQYYQSLSQIQVSTNRRVTLCWLCPPSLSEEHVYTDFSNSTNAKIIVDTKQAQLLSGQVSNESNLGEVICSMETP